MDKKTKPHAFEIEKRNDKYYLIFSDGEKEYTEQEFQELQQQNNQTMRYLEKGTEYAKSGNWSVGSVPKEFDGTVIIDLCIEDLLQAIELNAKQGRQSNDYREIVETLIRQAHISISNPLKKDQRRLNKYFLKQLKGVLPFTNLPPQQSDEEQQEVKKNNTVEQYNTFESLFRPEYQQNISDFTKLLQNTARPIIDDESKYISGNATKGVFVVFWDALKGFSIVYTKCGRKVIAALFNNKFPGLSISDSLFSQENIRAKTLYQHEFQAEIASIKANLNKKH